MNRFIVCEPTKCIGCKTCEVACAIAHTPTSSVEGMTPANFTPRIQVMLSRTVSSAVTCHHCEDAPCLNACPSGAIYTSNNTIQIEQSRCLGCKSCVVACPFGVMEVITHPVYRAVGGVQIADGVKAEAHKCDLCRGRAAGPACVEVCPTAALHQMDEALLEAIQQRRRQRSAIEPGFASLFG